MELVVVAEAALRIAVAVAIAAEAAYRRLVAAEEVDIVEAGSDWLVAALHTPQVAVAVVAAV
eukprot:CAMPEP_0197047986 /NCGR_PEP_ID=MMETSP1384-20130603/23408_1 /TAXON_ID=29189 /ORGANISM="Ammonia sp." /LENGTH=61 /DNA_ID=CAMNT_0042480029 /DNA_START=160 /DNA_END=342 /DNA_ORIENTATION=+